MGTKRMAFRLHFLNAIVSDDRVFFVMVNVAVNFLFLLRSYVTMRTLNYSDLGLVALLQTIMLFVGTLQLGVINGGYRLLCSEGDDSARVINNFVYTFVGGLAVVLFALAGCASVFSRDPDYALVTSLAIAAGILTIIKNWMTNYMIAKIMLRRLNYINLISTIASIAPLVFVSSSPLLICMGSIALQPLAFVVYLLATEKILRPKALAFSIPLLRKVLSAGFVVFLTSMFLMANSQIERWSILSYLGVDGLGRFYLALLFLNLYALIPSSLDAIFLPKVVQAYVREDITGMQADMRRFLYATISYAMFASLGVWLLGHVIIGSLLPKYIDDLKYVYLVMPGAVLLGLTSPFAIVFNVVIRYRYYFYAYGLGTLATIALLGSYVVWSGSLNLTALSIIKSVVSIMISIVIVVGYATFLRPYPAFQFGIFRKPVVER
jgi:O-antigen/teichoic acid export membrane protein